MAEKQLTEIGQSGIKHQGGVIQEEFLRQLAGKKGILTYREMRENDSVVGSLLFSIEMRMRSTEWITVPAGTDAYHLERADFAESLKHDMSHSWDELLAEIGSMVQYGFSYHEVVYKVCSGLEGDPPSHHDDGKVRWRKIPIRSQETLNRWELDDNGGIQGMWQDTSNGVVFIPIEKAGLFRTTAHKNNPQGRSALRSAYPSWWRKTRAETFEGIGIERDLVGIPLIKVPSDVLDTNNDSKTAERQKWRTIGKNLRNDEQAYVMLPSDRDADGNLLYEITLLSGGGNAERINTAPVIERYSRHIAMSVLADVVLMGHERVGSEALSKVKDKMFTQALDAWNQAIAAVFNDHLLPRVFQINGMPTDEMPVYQPKPLTEVSLDELGKWITDLTKAGAPLFPDDELEQVLRTRAGLPIQSEDRPALEAHQEDVGLDLDVLET